MDANTANTFTPSHARLLPTASAVPEYSSYIRCETPREEGCAEKLEIGKGIVALKF